MMAHINTGHMFGGFPAPNGGPGMMNNRFTGPPRFMNNHPWRPHPERPNFNISRFMQPPHLVQRPEYVPDIFGQEASNGLHENFPFNSHQNGHQGIRPYFRGQPGQSRGAMRGHQRGQSFNSGYRGGFSNRQSNHSNKNKKEKIDKRDLPENNVYFCDICDRGFKTEDKYKEHVDGHIKCSFKDCPFIAAPKLVQLHKNMQHRSGLASRVWKMESEDDVNKWREERKKNYPTTDNVTKKRQEKAERMARGEVLHTKEFGKMRRGRGGNNRHGHRGRGRGRGWWRDYDQEERRNVPMSDDGHDSDGPPEEVAIKKSTAADECDFESEPQKETAAQLSDELHSETVQPVSLNESSESSAGGLALLASYGDSSSDAEEEHAGGSSGTSNARQATAAISLPSTPGKTSHLPNPSLSQSSPGTTSPITANQTPINKKSPSPKKTSTSAVSSTVQDRAHNGSAIENNSAHITNSENAAMSSPNTPQKQNSKNGKSETKRDIGNSSDRKRELAYKRSEPEVGPSAKKKREQIKPHLRKYTLLEKLLAPEIRRERNKILQCVHYIVKNRFFESNLPEVPTHSELPSNLTVPSFA